MILEIQIKSFIYSFLFGCVFYFLLDIFNRVTQKGNIFLKIVGAVLFTVSSSLLYFLILLHVNNGYVHVYFLISILVGYIFVYFLVNKWFTHKKKIN